MRVAVSQTENSKSKEFEVMRFWGNSYSIHFGEARRGKEVTRPSPFSSEAFAALVSKKLTFSDKCKNFCTLFSTLSIYYLSISATAKQHILQTIMLFISHFLKFFLHKHLLADIIAYSYQQPTQRGYSGE